MISVWHGTTARRRLPATVRTALASMDPCLLAAAHCSTPASSGFTPLIVNLLPSAERRGSSGSTVDNAFTSTGGQSNLTKGRIAAAHERFNRIRQVAPMWPPSNARFLGPARVHNANGISAGSAVFAGFTIVTDRQTDRQTTLLRL